MEDLSGELQRQKAERLARSVGGLSEVATTDIPSATQSIIGDGTSQTDSFVHASQMADSTVASSLRVNKSKVQLWHDMKIQCRSSVLSSPDLSDSNSHNARLDSAVHSIATHPPDEDSAQPAR